MAPEIKHTFQVSELERLSSWLADDKGALTICCQFKIIPENSVLMTIEINGQLNVLCKRCMSAFAFNWSSTSDIQLDEEGDNIVEGNFDELYESVTLAHNGTFNLIDVVIDEVILGLPETHQEECVHALGHEF